MAHPAWTAQPNRGHRALADLETGGRLHALITQNIDGLHQKAGNSPERVIEVHGTVLFVVCLACGWRGPMQEVLERLRAGEDDPPCTECGGILKSDTISFGQSLKPGVIERAMRVSQQADLLLALGSTLQVYPVAGVVPAAKQFDAKVVIINAQPTQFDDIADAVISAPIGDVLPAICSP
jgi:NAD-dependent deacetylase